MAAGVHHGHGLPGTVGRRHVARVGQTRGFLDRECVHVGAQHDDRSFAVTQQTHNAGLSDAGGHFIAGGTKMVRRNASRSCFLHRQFGMSMNIFVDGFQTGKQATQVCKYRGGVFQDSVVHTPESFRVLDSTTVRLTRV